MYVFLGLLIILLVYNLREREGFVIHIEGGGMDVPLREYFQSITNGIRGSIFRPMYSTITGFIPYKNHIRKFRRKIR
jgi:hypothetical protein